MADSPKSAEMGGPEDRQSEMSEDEIDLNLIETFPASDPPSWTLGTDHLDKPLEKQGAETDAEESTSNALNGEGGETAQVTRNKAT